MAYKNLSVSYNDLSSKASQIQTLCESGHYVIQSIDTAKSHFSVSNSDTSSELIKILEKYKSAHNIIMEVCSRSITMLEKAKFVYSDSDYTSEGYLNGEED